MNYRSFIAGIAVFGIGALALGVSFHALAEDTNGRDDLASSTASMNADMRPPMGPGQDGRGMPPPPPGMKGMEDRQDGPGTGNSQPSFGIKPSGEVMIQHGTVTASSGSSLTVTVLGFTIPVSLTASTTIDAASSTVNTGDFVDVRGSIVSSSGVITAKSVRDLSSMMGSSSSSTIDGLRAQIKALLDKLHALQAQFHL